MIYIITGKPGAGKTTMAERLCMELGANNRTVHWFDGDVWRHARNNRDFNKVGRLLNISTAVEQAKAQLNCVDDIVFSFVLPYLSMRDYIRESFEESVTIYIPGGKLWSGTEYETPTPKELGYYKNERSKES
jgi:adenylylsulfate kinase-like enzyme